MTASVDITKLLANLRDGQSQAADELLPFVYDQLKLLACRQFDRERPDHTLQPTALVHEAYIQLVDQTRATIRDQQHFLAVAAMVMRRILTDHARSKGRIKRGGGRQRVELDHVLDTFETESGFELLQLNGALRRLSKLDSRKARVVELRFFGGMTVEEIAEVLHISPKTVKREWAVAKGWLYREMTGPDLINE